MFTIIGGDGKEYGPASVEQLRGWIKGGRVNLETQAKALGTDEWRRLGDFAEFTTPDAPPPLVPPVFLGERVGEQAAVPIEAPLAGFGARFAGALIDGIAVLLCRIPTMVVIWQAVQEQIASGSQPNFMAMVTMASQAMSKSYPYLAALVVVQCVLLTMRGQSLGKLAVGTRIVRESDGTQAGIVRAFLLRGTIPTVISLIPLLGFLFWLVDTCFIFGEQRRCVHDYIAGTKVVKA